MKRVGAALVAVGLVAVAALALTLARRHHHSTSAARPAAKPSRGRPYRLTCATEVASVCSALASGSVTVTVEAPGVTADRLATLAAGADPGFDGWVAAAPWADIVRRDRDRATLPAVTRDPVPVGQTRVAIALWRDRGIALRSACGGTLSWNCIGQAAGRKSWASNTGDAAWGDVKIALADPGIDSGGLEGLGAATAGFVGSTTFVPADLQQNANYVAWFGWLTHAIPPAPPDFTTVLAQGPSAADLYVGLAAPMSAAIAASPRRADIELVYLSPVYDVIETLTAATAAPVSAPFDLSAALRRAGWSQDPPSPTPPPQTASLAALREQWQDSPH